MSATHAKSRKQTVECHSLCCFVNGAELQEGEVLIEIYLTCQDWVADSLSQAGQVHLLVEELHHLLFSDAERNISNVKTSSLTGNGGPNNRNRSLWSICDDIRRNLPGGLHGLVLQRSDVLESWWWNIPVPEEQNSGNCNESVCGSNYEALQ